MAIAHAETETEWLTKAASLAPVIEQYRDDGEANRELPQPIYLAMREAGLYKMLLSRAWGGSQIDIVTSLRVYEEIARHDGSVAWNLMIGSQGGLFADYLPEAEARAIYDGGDTIAAGNFGPMGQAIPVDGGYRMTGRWPFASGCRHANWLVGGCLIMEDGKPRTNADGAPVIQLMLVPASEGRIIDTWQTGGLRGTGSHDIEVNDIFVPAERGFSFAQLMRGAEHRESRGYPQPFNLLAGVGMAALALGIARDALDSFKQLASEKTPAGSSGKLLTQPVVHDRFAEATALVVSSRSHLYEVSRELADAGTMTEDLGARVRLAGAHAARCAEHAVEIVYSLGGGTSIYQTSRLDRCFRDVHTVSHHVAVAPAHFELVGRYLLTGEMAARR